MSRLPPQDPARVKSTHPHDGESYEHPAFGQISAARVSASPGAVLYGSDFLHQHFVVVRVNRSQLGRDLNHDWHFGREELIEVWLSEAQWATFVSSLNAGDGPPCTLNHVAGKEMPPLTLRRNEDVARRELNALVKDAGALIQTALDAAQHELEGVSKVKKARVVESLEQLQRAVADHLPWMAHSFSKHMETTTEKAKIEVNAYITSQVQRAGLVALGADAPAPLQLGPGPEEPPRGA